MNTRRLLANIWAVPPCLALALTLLSYPSLMAAADEPATSPKKDSAPTETKKADAPTRETKTDKKEPGQKTPDAPEKKPETPRTPVSVKKPAEQKKVAPVIEPRKGKSETIKLFNGKDLTGWIGHEHLWSVVDGVIVAKNTKPITVSTYLLTKDKYTDFRLTLSAKLVTSEMHSGVAFWGANAPEHGDKYTYAGHLVMFPSGWGMYDLFGRKGLPVDGAPAKKVGKQHDWNDLEILAQGNRVRLVANGHLVVDWRDPEPDRIKEAPIGLQLHSNNQPQEVHFKDIVITTFPEDKLTTLKE